MDEDEDDVNSVIKTIESKYLDKERGRLVTTMLAMGRRATSMMTVIAKMTILTMIMTMRRRRKVNKKNSKEEQKAIKHCHASAVKI